jgi:hypothetical protein
MTWTIAKIATAGVLAAMPVAAVSIPAYAAENPGGAPIVLPQQNAPPQQNYEYYNPNDWYNMGSDGGGGGGGGGG